LTGSASDSSSAYHSAAQRSTTQHSTAQRTPSARLSILRQPYFVTVCHRLTVLPAPGPGASSLDPCRPSLSAALWEDLLCYGGLPGDWVELPQHHPQGLIAMHPPPSLPAPPPRRPHLTTAAAAAVAPAPHGWLLLLPPPHPVCCCTQPTPTAHSSPAGTQQQQVYTAVSTHSQTSACKLAGMNTALAAEVGQGHTHWHSLLMYAWHSKAQAT
jgi:hypothetical protein